MTRVLLARRALRAQGDNAIRFGARSVAARDPRAPGFHRHRAAAVRRDPRSARPPQQPLTSWSSWGQLSRSGAREGEEVRHLGHAESTAFRSAPSFFAVASSRPIDQIVMSERRRSGRSRVPSVSERAIDPEEQARFTLGLVDLRVRQGLYQEDSDGVTISDGVLYQARIEVPSNVTTGRYTAETFAITDGRVIASAIAEVQVQKQGFERFVAEQAEDSAFLYGLFAVLLSLFMGWVAGRVFALV